MLKYFKVFFHNKVFIYLSSRYLTYFIQFVTSLIIAAELGPYYMGIWGFLLLLLQYFQQIHFGIANSFNVLYVHNRDNDKECGNYIGNSLVLITYLALLVIFFYLYYLIFGIKSFDKYNVDRYIIWICLIAIMQYYVLFFINLFRVKNRLNSVAFCQSVIVILNFVCVFFFKGERLIVALIAGYVIGNLLCIILAAASGTIPRFGDINFRISYQKEIISKGLFLFLYNSCFYFIIIAIRSIISGYYTVEEFGIFTFSFTLAHAILLILDAVSFVIFPKVIGKLSSKSNNEVTSTISFLRTTYITLAHALIYVALPCFPIFLHFMPKYSGALTSLNLIALTVLMSTNSYSYLELLISRNKEKLLAVLSFSALVVNCIIAFILVLIFRVSFSYVIISTMITYLLFSFTAMSLGKKELGLFNVKDVFKELMPLRLLIPYITAVILSLGRIESFIWVPIVLFFVFNWKVKDQIISTIKVLTKRPETVNL